MSDSAPRRVLASALLALSCAPTFHALAGGSGLNTVVIVNQNSSNSCELGNYYCERRQVPPENLLRISWPGGNISWSSNDFQANLLAPLLDMLASRQLTNQIDYVVLSMDLPFQTTNAAKINSTTSVLFYGFMDDTGPNWMNVTNSYSGAEQIFRQAQPATAPGYSFLASMLTADSLAQAKLLVDQGVASDGTFPTQPVILAKSSDPLRNIRYHAFDNAIFNTRLRGNYSLLRTNEDSPSGQTNLLGCQLGLANFSLSPNMLHPGAIADSLIPESGAAELLSVHQNQVYLSFGFYRLAASSARPALFPPCYLRIGSSRAQARPQPSSWPRCVALRWYRTPGAMKPYGGH